MTDAAFGLGAIERRPDNGDEKTHSKTEDGGAGAGTT